MTNGNNRNTFLDGITMDELVIESSPHSPTDSSEDSVEVKVEAIASRSKRKLTEPRRLHDGPLKKRTCIRAEESTPFRPWSLTPLKAPTVTPAAPTIAPPASPPATSSVVAPRQYFRPPSPPPQPIDLIKRSAKVVAEDIRIPIHPTSTCSSAEAEAALSASTVHFPTLAIPKPVQRKASAPRPSADDGAGPSKAAGSSEPTKASDIRHSETTQASQRKEQRNYKNMTRERRIEANARERTRVHTISAAFDTLRRAVPAYSHSQKLSKLSVLRIACSYIMTLSNILEDSPDLPESVENVGRTIQREGKLRKKKDE